MLIYFIIKQRFVKVKVYGVDLSTMDSITDINKSFHSG